MVGEIQNLVVSEHVIRSSQAMADGHEWPRMRQRVARMQSQSRSCWRCGKEHGSYLKEESQGSGHREVDTEYHLHLLSWSLPSWSAHCREGHGLCLGHTSLKQMIQRPCL